MPRLVNGSDPRVQRTHRLLLDAFMTLVQEKRNFNTISIREIALRARVNRATFYAHFEDKYALIVDWSRDKFRRAVASELPPSPGLEKETLRRLISAVFDFMASSRRYYRPSNRQFEPLYEIAIQQEMFETLLRWLREAPSGGDLPEEALETTAQVISGAIFGPALHWSRGDQTRPKEVMVDQVLAIIVAGLSAVAAVA